MAIDVNESLSVVDVSGIQALPDGKYSVQVSPYDGSSTYGTYEVEFVNGAAMFTVPCQPFQALRCNILSGGFPGTKSVDFTSKAHMACYANSTYITNNGAISETITNIDNRTYTAGSVFLHSSGVSFTFANSGAVSILPRSAGQNLEPNEKLVLDIPVTHESGFQDDLKVYILASEEVGQNLASDNSDTHALSLTEDKVYEIALTGSGATTGDIHPEIAGDTTSVGDYVLSTNDREVWHLRAPANTTAVNLVRANGYDGNVSDLHIREVLTDSGAVTTLDYFSVEGGTGEVDISWVPKPVAGYLSDVEAPDEVLTGYLGAGTWYKTTDENWVLEFPAPSRMVFTEGDGLKAPVNSSWKLSFLYGFDPSDYGRPFSNKDSDSSRVVINPFNGTCGFRDADGVNYGHGLPVGINLLDLNLYQIVCTETNELIIYINGEQLSRNTDPADYQNCTAGLNINRINSTQEISPPTGNAYLSNLKLEVEGVLKNHLSAADSNRASTSVALTDIGSSPVTMTAIGIPLIASPINGYVDDVGVVNVKAHNVTSVAKAQGIRRETGVRDRVTGYTEVVGSTFIGGYTGFGDDSQRGLVLGSNSDSAGVVMFAGNYADIKKEPNLNNYDENSDCFVFNSNAGEVRHGSRAFTFANTLLGGSDGQGDYKISLDAQFETWTGGNFQMRMHSPAVTKASNLTFTRVQDSRGAFNLNYPQTRCLVFNAYVDDVRAMNAQQLEDFKNPITGAHFTAEGALYGWDDTTPAVLSQFYVAKTKIRHHPHCAFNLTDYELEYSVAGTGNWTPLALDGNHLQGINGAPLRTLTVAAGNYDLRLRAKFGNRVGLWSQVSNVEVA